MEGKETVNPNNSPSSDEALLCGWALEFLLRQNVDDKLVKKIISKLPSSVADGDLRLRKTIVLRSVESVVSGGGEITEDLLRQLELLEELDHLKGVSSPESLKEAYCAVAVECSVKLLGGGQRGRGANWDLYIIGLYRIWEEKIAEMSQCPTLVGLVSDDLRRWKDRLEHALFDAHLLETILTGNTKENAVQAVKAYLRKSWEDMGPPFIQVAASQVVKEWAKIAAGNPTNNHTVAASRVLGTENVAVRNPTRASSSNPIDKDRGIISANIRPAPQVLETANVAAPNPTRASSSARNDNDGGVFANNHTVSAPHELETANVSATNLTRASSSTPKDKDEGITVTNIHTVAQERTVPSKRKHTGANVEGGHARGAILAKSRGAKISNTEELREGTLIEKYKRVPSADILRAKGALRSSCLDLHAVVEDPLPQAMCSADKLLRKMAMESVCGCAVENLSTTKANVLGHSSVLSPNENKSREAGPVKKGTSANHSAMESGRGCAVENLSTATENVPAHSSVLLSKEQKSREAGPVKKGTPANHSVMESGCGTAVENLSTAKANVPANSSVLSPDEKKSREAGSVKKGTPTNHSAEVVQATALPLLSDVQVDASQGNNGSSGKFSSKTAHVSGNNVGTVCHEWKSSVPANNLMPSNNNTHTDKVDAFQGNDGISGKSSETAQVSGNDVRNLCHDLRTSMPENNLMPSNNNDHSVECLESPDVSPCKIHLQSPKMMHVSPLKKTTFVSRRRKKKWSVLEEDTLRTAVTKYGRGNWKLILSKHTDIFEERTEVDLKDKWRNLVGR